MAVTWDKVEVKTEKVIDTNPDVWLKAARDELNKKNYGAAFHNSEQAIEFANDAASYSVLPECYAIEIYACYETGDAVAADDISIAQMPNGLRDFLFNKPEYVKVFKGHNNLMWMPLWRDMVKSWISKCNFKNLNKYEDLIETELLLSAANYNFVLKAVENNGMKWIKLLFENGFDLSRIRSSDGATLLMKAVEHKSGIVLDFLIEQRINDVDEKDNNGQTALMYAALKNNNSYVVTLIKAGADVNAKDNNGGTALIAASFLYSTSVADILIKAGADVNAKNNEGFTALMAVASKGSSNTADLLIKAGADVNSKDNKNYTALYYSFSNANIYVMEKLLDNHADPNISYDSGKTLLHLIADNEHWKAPNNSMWQLLLRYNADVNCKDYYGYTPLYYSVNHNWFLSDELDMARALVRKGATVTSDVRNVLNRRNIEPDALYNNQSSNAGTKALKFLDRFFR